MQNIILSMLLFCLGCLFSFLAGLTFRHFRSIQFIDFEIKYKSEKRLPEKQEEAIMQEVGKMLAIYITGEEEVEIDRQ
jgi:hypothetical protein